MTFDKGSLILVDYTAKIKDSEEIFDTTLEEDAKKHSVYEQNVMYQPKLVSIGETSYPVLTGLDEALAKTSVGEKLTVEVTPDKGFGERNPGKVRMIPIRKLGEDAESVSIGDTVQVDNKTGIIRFIGSGRVQIDYNHRYAGKTILFDVNVIKSLDSPNDKIHGILKDKFLVEDSEIVFDLKEREVSITIPEELLRLDGLENTKYLIQFNIFKFVPTLIKVNFIESYLNKQPQEENPEQENFGGTSDPDDATEQENPEQETT